MESFRALVSRGDGKGANSYNIEQCEADQLPENDVLIRVHYSSLNFKDALCAKGHKGITRSYPHTPGIDAAGEVVASETDHFSKGDEVIVTGFDLGMNTWGGFSEFISVPSKWVIRKPAKLSAEQAMAFGTAGLTAGISFWKLKKLGISNGTLVVTGASGGVGSLSVLLGKQLGFNVTACSRKEDEYEWILRLGADKIMSYDELVASPEKPLLSALADAAIDTVGGEILSGLTRLIDKEGAIAICGNASGHLFETTVYPSILRGVSYLGVDSAHLSLENRVEIWQMLEKEWYSPDLNELYSVITLDDLPDEIERISQGKQIGRKVIRLI
jgi:alcohol dehydrogenase